MIALVSACARAHAPSILRVRTRSRRTRAEIRERSIVSALGGHVYYGRARGNLTSSRANPNRESGIKHRTGVKLQFKQGISADFARKRG